LIPALRLLEVVPNADEIASNTWTQGSQIASWESTDLGTRDTMDPEIEARVYARLRQICESLRESSEAGIQKLAQFRKRVASDKNSSLDYALSCLEVLWNEEHDVAIAVIESIDRGIDF